MAPKWFLFFQSSVFQAIFSFLVGYILSSQLLYSFLCQGNLKNNFIRLENDTDWKTVSLNYSLENATDYVAFDLETTKVKEAEKEDDVQKSENMPKPTVSPPQSRHKIGCIVLYNKDSPSAIMLSSWVPQCDAQKKVKTINPFPRKRKEKNGTNETAVEIPSLEKLFKLHPLANNTNSTKQELLDFYLFAPHDTYIVMDNLREYLSHCDPSEPHSYGHPLVEGLVESGCPWYTVEGTLILSRQAMIRVLQQPKCLTYEIPSMATIVKCLYESGGHLVDTRDQFAKNTFLAPARPFEIITGQADNILPKNQTFSVSYCNNVECLSDFPIAFHKLRYGEIYLLDFLIDWAHYSHYTGINRYSKLRLKFNGSKLPLAPEATNSNSTLKPSSQN